MRSSILLIPLLLLLVVVSTQAPAEVEAQADTAILTVVSSGRLINEDDAATFMITWVLRNGTAEQVLRTQSWIAGCCGEPESIGLDANISPVQVNREQEYELLLRVVATDPPEANFELETVPFTFTIAQEDPLNIEITIDVAWEVIEQ